MFSGAVQFKAEHLRDIMNDEEREFFNLPLCKVMEGLDTATFVYNDVVQCCGGITPYWEGRGQVWIVFNKNIRANFIPTFRAIKNWLTEMQKKYRRIEVCINYEFEPGKRRAEMLGFKLECEKARKYLPDGKDCSLYSLVVGD